MKDLLTGEQILFTERQNFAALKSYRILKFGKLVGFLIKKDAKIEFSDVLRIFELLLHLQSNLAEIWNPPMALMARCQENARKLKFLTLDPL